MFSYFPNGASYSKSTLKMNSLLVISVSISVLNFVRGIFVFISKVKVRKKSSLSFIVLVVDIMLREPFSPYQDYISSRLCFLLGPYNLFNT